MNLLFQDKKVEQEEDSYELTAVLGKKTVGRLEYRKRNRIRIYSIEVPEKYRKQGIGSALVHYLALKGKEEGRYMIEVLLTEAVIQKAFGESRGKSNEKTEEISELGYFMWRCGFEPVAQNEMGTHYVLLLQRSADDIGEDSVRVLQERLLSLSEDDNEEGIKESDLDEVTDIDYESLIDLDSDQKDESKGEEDEDERFARFASTAALEPVSNSDFICGSCIYRTSGKNVMTCHKYADKPYTVLTDDECEFYLGS